MLTVLYIINHYNKGEEEDDRSGENVLLRSSESGEGKGETHAGVLPDMSEELR